MWSHLQQWRIVNVGALFVGFCLYYLNRKCFFFLLPDIIETEGLKNNDLGAISSSLSLAYTISKFIGGIASDHVSPRVMFSSGLFATGVLTLQLSISNSVTSYILVTFLSGLVQGCGWPAVAKVLKQWYPTNEIGLWWSLISAGSNLAGTVGPLGLAYLTLTFGWRGSMQFCGCGAIIASVIAGFVIRSSPTDVGLPPIQNSIKQTSTRSDKDSTSSTTSNLVAILSSPALWVIALLFLANNFLVHGVTDWGQLFLIQEKGLSNTVGSSFTSAYSLGAIVGSITSGYITDKLVTKYGHRSRGTPRYPWILFIVTTNLVAIHALRNYIDADSYHEVILLVGLSLGFSQYSGNTLFGILAVESAPLTLSGTSHAFAALASNVGGVLAGIPLTYVAQHYSWTVAIYCMEAVSFLSLIVMIFMRRMKMRIGYPSVKKTE